MCSRRRADDLYIRRLASYIFTSMSRCRYTAHPDSHAWRPETASPLVAAICGGGRGQGRWMRVCVRACSRAGDGRAHQQGWLDLLLHWGAWTQPPCAFPAPRDNPPASAHTPPTPVSLAVLSEVCVSATTLFLACHYTALWPAAASGASRLPEVRFRLPLVFQKGSLGGHTPRLRSKEGTSSG